MGGERATRGPRLVRAKAFAKINLTLHVLGTRSDGYHDLRTTFQSLALHDTLTFAAARDGFEIECDDPRCPTGRANLVWRAAALMWRAAGRAGDPAGVRVRLEKRIPAQAGLGGGSSDALATLRALGTLWRVKVDDDRLLPMAVNLGADVPFFLEGGAALGVERGDGLLPLADLPRLWVVLVVPNFGVSTEEAYAWFDRNVGSSARPVQSGGGRVPERRARRSLSLPVPELGNDLQAPVVERHPKIGRIVHGLERRGASYAAMSGSGSAVFGLFAARQTAETAAHALAASDRQTLVTRTTTRRDYHLQARPRVLR